MKLRLLFIFLLFGVVIYIYADTPVKKTKEWLYTITSDLFGGRRSGTDGCKKAFEYIKDQVSAMGYSPEVAMFKYEDAIFRNIIVHVGIVKDTVIVVGAHYDGPLESNLLEKYPAADDNASGVVTVLLLLKQFKENKVNTHYPILFCFWDGEEYSYGDIFKGAKNFVENNKKTILFYINIDTVGHDHNQTNTISFIYRGDGVSNKIEDILNSKRFKFRYSKAPKEVGSSDHVPFDAQDIPYIFFYDSPAANHKECGHDLHSVNDVPEAVSIDRIVNLSELVFHLLNK